MSKTTNHSADIHAGHKLRQRRLLVGMTQEQLAEAVDVSFQMIQKYEKGARISVSRLTQIARALGVSEAFFFSGEPTQNRKVAEDKEALNDDVLTSKETITLLKAYYALPDQTRKHMLDILKDLKDKDGDKAAGGK